MVEELTRLLNFNALKYVGAHFWRIPFNCISFNFIIFQKYWIVNEIMGFYVKPLKQLN